MVGVSCSWLLYRLAQGAVLGSSSSLKAGPPIHTVCTSASRMPRSQRTKMGLTYVYGCVHTEVRVCHHDHEWAPTLNMRWRMVRDALAHAVWLRRDSSRGKMRILPHGTACTLCMFFPCRARCVGRRCPAPRTRGPVYTAPSASPRAGSYPAGAPEGTSGPAVSTTTPAAQVRTHTHVFLSQRSSTPGRFS